MRQACTVLCVEQHSQVCPVYELEGHVGCSVDLAEVDHADDVAVPQLGREPCFPLEQPHEVFVVPEEGEHQLEAHVLCEPARPAADGLVRFRHAPHAQTPDQAIWTEILTDDVAEGSLGVHFRH